MAYIKYFLTYHAIERLQERFPEIVQLEWKLKLWERPQSVNVVKHFFDNLINESQENRAYWNNTNYMIHLYDTYGYETEYKFMENIKYGILFVMAKERNEKVFCLVTLMPTEYRKKFCLNNIKYNNKETKENKKKKAILNLYSDFQKSTQSFENESLSTLERLSDLEKIDNFSNIYNNYLSDFLNDLAGIEILNNNGVNIVFSSKNYEYNFFQENKIIKFTNIKALNQEEKNERINYFILLNNLNDLIYDSTIIKKNNNNTTVRMIVFKDFKYEILYYENINKIEIIKIHNLNSIELVNYIELNFLKDVKNNFLENYFYILEKNESILLCQTTINDKSIIFQYEENKNNFIIKQVTYMYEKIGSDYKDIERKIISMLGNAKLNTIEELSNEKFLKSITIKNKEYKFIHFTIMKKILVIDIKILIENTCSEIENIENIEFTAIEIDKYNKLTASLSKEEDCFLRRISGFEETVTKQISKRKTIHNVIYQGYNYEFLLTKTRKEGYLILVMKKENVNFK